MPTCYIPFTLRYIKATLICAGLAAFFAACLFELGVFRLLDNALSSFLGYIHPKTTRVSQYTLIFLLSIGIAWTTVDIGRNALKAIVALLTLVEILTAVWVLNLHGIFLSPFGSIAAIILSFSIAFSYSQTNAGRRKHSLHQLLGQRVSARTFAGLLECDASIEVDREHRIGTIVVCRIFNNDELANTLSEQDRVVMTKAFLRNSAEILLERGGYLDEFDTESLRVVFGALLPNSDHATTACQAALELAQRLYAVNRECHCMFGRQFDYRVGINSGEMLMTSKLPDEISIAGDSLEFAHSLCAANTIYGMHILVGSKAFSLAEEGMEVRPMEIIQRHLGTPDREEVYELLARHGTPSTPESKRRDLFWKGIVYFREQRWDDALTAFRDAGNICGPDAPSEFYMRRIEQIRSGQPTLSFNNITH